MNYPELNEEIASLFHLIYEDGEKKSWPRSRTFLSALVRAASRW